MHVVKHRIGTAFGAGLWNTNEGGGRFMMATRKVMTIRKKVQAYKKIGLTHVEAHDTDIANIGAKEFAKILRNEGMKWGMYTPNMFKARKEYAGGALDHPQLLVRRMAIKQFKWVIDEAVENGVEIVVWWNGMAGFNVPFEKDHVRHLKYLVDAFTEVIRWGGDCMPRIAIEPKPNEPRDYMYLGTVGDALAFIGMLPEDVQPYVGVNPETAHSKMARLSYPLDLSMAILAKKLFWVHLNDQNGCCFDQDKAFGDVNLVEAFEVVNILSENGFDSVLSFDVQPLASDRNNQQTATLERSLKNLKFCLERRKAIDHERLQELRTFGDAHEITCYIRDILLDLPPAV